jgi:hypothetical protein
MTTQQNNDNGHNDCVLGVEDNKMKKMKRKNHKECFKFILGLATKVGSRQMGNGLKVS